MEELPAEKGKKKTVDGKRELKLILTKSSSSEISKTKAKKIKLEVNLTPPVSSRTLIEHESPETIRLKLIKFYQKKATANTSCLTRGRAAARLELFELLDPFPFEMLPVELQHEVFKALPLGDKKSVRLVCKDWKDKCTDLLKLCPVLKSARTFDEITTTDTIFQEMTVQRFVLKMDERIHRNPGYEHRGWKCGHCGRFRCMKMDERQQNSFVGGGNIFKLNFQESAVEVDNLKWLFTSCHNLKEIRIDYRRCWRYGSNARDFLSTKLPEAISLCENLQKLDFFVGHSCYRVTSILNFDCSCLQLCKNLKYLNIRSLGTGTFNLKNCTKLPTSLRRLNVLVLLLRSSPPEFHNQIVENLIEQFQAMQTEDVSLTHPSKRIISIEDLIEVQKYFEMCSTINFVSNSAPEWEIFLDIIPGIMDQVMESQYRGQPLHDHISSISNFSLIRADKAES